MVVSVDDKIAFKDQEVKKNRFDIFDSKGEHVYRGYNIVVNKGRLFNVQNAFNVHIDDSVSIHKKQNQWVSAFAVGDGAAPESDLMNPQHPAVTESELYNPVQFVPEDSTREYVGNDETKPKYWNETYIKDIDAIEIKHDVDTQDVYAELSLKIEMDECKGKNINEAVTYLVEHELDVDGNVTSKQNFVVFSKFSFASLPNAIDATNEYTILYRIYG